MDLGYAISLLVGVIGTAAAIYQTAVLNENKKRKKEIQYLLAGIGQLALAKQMEWANQIRLYPAPNIENQQALDIMRLLHRARDGFAEINTAASALEGSIDSSSSATLDLMRKTIEQGKLNLELQGIQPQPLIAEQKNKTTKD